MSDTPESTSSPDTAGTETTGMERPDPAAAGAASVGRARRLPFGPFGLMAVTAVALLIAGGIAWLAYGVLADDQSNTTDISDALDDVTFTPADGNRSPARTGDPAPNVRLEMIGAENTELSAIAGQGIPVVLNFWSSTCAPCLKEMPTIESVSSDLGDRAIVLGINSQDTVEAAQEMITKTGVTYDNARDPDGSIATRFGALALPRTVLIDSDGVITASHTGELSRDEFIELLSKNDFPTP